MHHTLQRLESAAKDIGRAGKEQFNPRIAAIRALIARLKAALRLASLAAERRVSVSAA